MSVNLATVVVLPVPGLKLVAIFPLQQATYHDNRGFEDPKHATGHLQDVCFDLKLAVMNVSARMTQVTSIACTAPALSQGSFCQALCKDSLACMLPRVTSAFGSTYMAACNG